MRALKELCHCYPAHLDVNNANYASLFALELEKLLMNDKIAASCQTNTSLNK